MAEITDTSAKGTKPAYQVAKEVQVKQQLATIKAYIAEARRLGECETVVLCDIYPDNKAKLESQGFLIRTLVPGYNKIGWANL